MDASSPLNGRVSPKWVAPNYADVMKLMGEPLTDVVREDLTLSTLGLVTTAARAYTRGRGFRGEGAGEQVADDIAGVLVTATARLMSNPTSARRVEAGNFSTVPGSFEGWSSAELAALNRYRRTCA